MTDTELTTLSEFDDADVDEETGGDESAEVTPAENADDIKQLIDLVGRLTDRVDDVATELGQRDTADGTEREPPDDPRMYH